MLDRRLTAIVAVLVVGCGVTSLAAPGGRRNLPGDPRSVYSSPGRLAGASLAGANDDGPEMKASVYHGPGDVRIDDVPDAALREPTDALVRITRAGICGSDLWFFRGWEELRGIAPGFRVGHEFLGVVEEVGVRRPQRCVARRPRGRRPGRVLGRLLRGSVWRVCISSCLHAGACRGGARGRRSGRGDPRAPGRRDARRDPRRGRRPLDERKLRYDAPVSDRRDGDWLPTPRSAQACRPRSDGGRGRRRGGRPLRRPRGPPARRRARDRRRRPPREPG